jgi:hypothetical protein
MTGNRSKSNKIKRNKTKRHRQTKNKRRRQHGGTKKPYTPDSQTIFKKGQVTSPVLIPGYSEIMDMMEEYDDPRGSDNRFISQSQILNDGIKQKDFQLLNVCSSQTQIEDGKIIVLRKQDKTRLGFIKLDNTNIECTDDQYYALASHNFRIFIQDILQWNPFLNLPQHKKKEEQQGWQGYSGPHKYSSEMIFTTDVWWNKQKWWTDYKGTAAAAAEARRAAAAAAEARRAAAQELTSSPQPARTQPTIEQQHAELPILTTVLNKLKTRLNDLQTEEKISEDVKNIINTEIDTLLSSTSQVFSS